jgi:nucleotide-binding universal stress UspA family protein
MRVLLAVDGSTYSDAAVRTVIDRFRPEDARVKVVHAVEWMREMPLCVQYAHGPTAGDDVVHWRNGSFERARDLVTRVAAQLEGHGFAVSTATPDADPRHAIVEAAREWAADLIVIGSHGRTGIDRLLLGSVARSVVRHAPCPVDVVRLPEAAASREAVESRYAAHP